MGASPDNLPKPAALNPQERAGREYLAQGRFRKARDEFKVLCKVDRARYLPLLVEANVGLAREMLAKGMLSEARQVVDYLKTIAPPERVLALELELGGNHADAGGRTPEVLRLLLKPGLDDRERRRLADGAVLMFQPVANLPQEIAGLGGDLNAIMEALRAISEGQLERALELVRPVPQASVFSHWKMFVKGLAAFHSGDRDKATRHFKGLPTDSAPGQASRSYLLLLGLAPISQGSPLPPDGVVEWACRIAGAANCGGPLLRSEQAWRKRDPVQMYKELRVGIARFPSEGLDFIGVLSEFAVNCAFTLPYAQCDAYLDFVQDIIYGGSSKSRVELQLFLRVAVLKLIHVMPDEEAIEFWEKFLRTREKQHGANPGLDSEAYGWMGDLMSRPHGPASRVGVAPDPGSRMRNAKEAQRLLQLAVSLDSANLAASLSLCEVYKRRRRRPERNRLLDEMSARFPIEKKVLLLAGEACVERKTYKKGLDYITQALAIDRLDPAIPDLIVKARLAQARDYFHKQRPDDAREVLEQIIPFEIETPGNLQRSRWCLNTRRGWLETLWGDQGKGTALLEEARRGSPSAAAFLYYAGFAGLALETRERFGTGYFEELARLAKREANAADALVLTRVWSQEQESIREHLAYKPREVLERFLKAAAKRPFVREDVCRLVEFALAEDWFAREVVGLVERQLKKDRQDPLFRLYRLRLRESYLGPSWNDERPVLEEIIAEASRRKDDQTVRQARQQLDALKSRRPMPMPPFGPPDPFEEPDFEDEIGGEDWEDGADSDVLFDTLGRDLGSDEMKTMEKLIEMIGNASESELKAMKQTRPPGISSEDFEVLVKVARMKKSFKATPPPPAKMAAPKPVVPRPPPPPDPRQAELF